MWSTRMKADPALVSRLHHPSFLFVAVILKGSFLEQAAELDRARLARDWQGAFNTVKKLSKYTTDPLLELLVKGLS